VRIVVVLTFVALLSGGVLAVTYNFSKLKIEQAQQQRLAESVFNVVPGSSKYEAVSTDALTYFRAFDDNNNLVGYAFVVEEPGFNDVITFMVGLDVQGEKIVGYSVLEHSETPGLGARTAEPPFSKQFIGKSVGDPFNIGEDIHAVTGATISSVAVVRGLKSGLEKVLQLIQ
jgi:electron transport complex protein RnfG